MEMATFSPLLISNSNAPASLACRLYLPLFRRLLYHPIAVLNTSHIAPCALRLPLIWQNTSIHCLQWVAAAASPDTSPLTPLGMGAYSAVRQIPHLRSEACRCCPDFARGRRFQCKSAATREDRAIVPILRVIGQETQQTAKIVSSTHNKTGRIGSEEYATDTAVTRA